MGNVYEQNLRDILKSERSIRVRQRVYRETDHCKIFCYREKEDPIAECDPLIPQIPEHFRLNRFPTKKPGREKMPRSQ